METVWTSRPNLTHCWSLTKLWARRYIQYTLAHTMTAVHLSKKTCKYMNFLCGKAVVKTDMIVLVVSRCKTSVPVSFLELELMFVSSNCFYFEIGCVCPTRITIWWELQSCISCLAQNTNRLNPFVFDMQERETYRWPVRESLKSMLAMGWNIERTKEGEAMFQQRESEKQRKTSESQVEQPDVGSARCATLYVAHYFKILLEKKNKKKTLS